MRILMRTNCIPIPKVGLRLVRKRNCKAELIMMQLCNVSCTEQLANCTTRMRNKKAQVIRSFNLDKNTSGYSIAFTKEWSSKLSIRGTLPFYMEYQVH